MMLYLCFVVTAGIITLIAGVIVGYRRTNEQLSTAVLQARIEVDQVKNALNDFFLPNEDGVSDFQQTIEGFSEILAQRIGVTVQASIRGQIGGAMNGIVPALQAEAAENLQDNPELVQKAFQESLPKSLKKNPLAAMILQQFVGKFIGNLGTTSPGARPGAPGGNGYRQAKFRL